MRQFILPEDWDGGPTCLIEGGRARYIGRVLRLGPGDSFPARDASGRLWDASVLGVSADRVLLAIRPGEGEARPASRVGLGGEPPQASVGIEARIVLFQSLPKGTKMDLIVRQATEAGAYAIVPIVSSRSAPAPEGSGRAERWERIVREAMQQSGSALRTQVLEPLPLPEVPAALAFLGFTSESPKVLLHESPLAQSSLHGYLTEAPHEVALCVGPEGGFSPDEVEFLLAAGFGPLRFAGAVLRAETAALCAIAAAQIILSERSSWTPRPQ
jgi:RNA methyltransferase, RsmE family